MRKIGDIHTFVSLAGPDIVAGATFVSFEPAALISRPAPQKKASLIEIAPRPAKYQQTA